MLTERTKDHQEAAQAAGYEAKQGTFIAEGDLHGVRYDAGNVMIPAAATELNRTYNLPVTEASGAAATAGKVLLTPITVTADGVIAIGSVPLVVALLRMCPEKTCF